MGCEGIIGVTHVTSQGKGIDLLKNCRAKNLNQNNSFRFARANFKLSSKVDFIWIYQEIGSTEDIAAMYS